MSLLLIQLQVVAGSHELGQDYEHVTLLWERFVEFARDTESIGCERVSAVNEIADRYVKLFIVFVFNCVIFDKSLKFNMRTILFV